MPKVLVLFHSRTGNTAALADRIVDGARSVRFTEVDVRRLEDVTPEPVIAADAAWAESRAQLRQRYRALDDVRMVADYDALVVGSPAHTGAPAAEVAHLLDQLAPLAATGALADMVGAAFTPASPDDSEPMLASLLMPLARLGLILVPPAPSAPQDHGARVATVAEWVRHAKSHAAGHHHHH